MATAASLPAVVPVEAILDRARPADLLLVPSAELARTIERVDDGDLMVTTPERAVGATPVDPLDRLAEVYRALDAPLAATERVLEGRRRAWRDSGDPVTDATGRLAQAVGNALRTLPGEEASLADATPPDGAVATLERTCFDRLQRRVVPDGSQELHLTTRDEDRPPATLETAPHRSTALAGTVEYVATHDPADVAVVVDPDGPYAEALRGSLTAEGIPHTGRGSPLAGGRSFGALLGCIATRTSTCVGDAPGLLADLGVDAAAIEARRPLDDLGDEAAVWLRTVTEEATSMALETVLDQFAFRTGIDVASLRDRLGRFGLLERTVTPRVAADVRHLMAIRPDPVTPSEDVAIVPASTAWTSPRESVLFLGPRPDWCRAPPASGTDRWPRRERLRLACLTAAGDERLVIAADTDPAPTDLGWWRHPADATRRSAEVGASGFAFTPEGRPTTGHDRFTQSTLNRTLHSPRDGAFATVLSSPAGRARTRGSAVHDYADLALSAPEAVEDIGRERLRQWLVDQISPLTPAHRRTLFASRLIAAMRIVDAYLSTVEPTDHGLDYGDPTWLDNRLAAAFDVPLQRLLTEQYFLDDVLGVSGVVDLIRTPTHLVDFKTGAPRSERDLVRRGRVPIAARTPDVQVSLYLAALRRRSGDRPLRMTFLYCHGAMAAALAGDTLLDALARTVTYRPQPRVVWLEGEGVDTLHDAVPGDHPRAVVLDAIGDRPLRVALARIDDEDGEPAAADLLDAALAAGIEDTVARAGVRSLLAGTRARLESTLFANDLDRFEQFLETMRERRQRYVEVGFPLGDPYESRLEFPRLHTDLSPTGGGHG